MLPQRGLLTRLGCCRCDDLECIYQQLSTRKVRNMMEVLERVESCYVPAFKDMLMDVEAGEMWDSFTIALTPGVTGFQPSVAVMTVVIRSLL